MKTIRSYQNCLPDLKIVDEFVNARREHASGNTEQENTTWKLWVLQQLRSELIGSAHNPQVAAHGGIGKTVLLIRRNFFWPGLVKDVRSYIRQYHICKATKTPNMILRAPMGQLVETERPFQRLYIDLLGPYPRSKRGHIGLLIVLTHSQNFTGCVL